MIKISKYTFFLLLFIGGAAITSCTKPVDPANPTAVIKDPTLALNPSDFLNTAGDQITVDFTCTVPRGLKHVKVEEQFNGMAKRVLLDSNYAKKPVFNDENFSYFVPDSAATGQVSILTFTITDTANVSVTKTAKITVSGSRPRLTVTQGAVTAHAGDSVMFVATGKSTENNLDSLVITQSINKSSPPARVKSFGYADVANFSKTYYYKVSSSAKAGDEIVLFFTARNSGTVTKVVTKTITVN